MPSCIHATCLIHNLFDCTNRNYKDIERKKEYQNHSRIYIIRYWAEGGWHCIYKDISDRTNRVTGDKTDVLLQHIKFDINGFGGWTQTDVSELRDVITPDYEIIYMLQGTACIDLDGHGYTCHAGSIVLLEPFHTYSAFCLAGDPVAFYYLHFDIQPVYLQDILRDVLLGGKGNVFLPQELPACMEALNEIYSDLKTGKEGVVALLHATLLSIMVHMIRSRASQDSLAKQEAIHFHQREVEIVHRSVQYIDQHIHEPIHIAALAKHVGVSPNHLYKTFERVVHDAPSRFVLSYKVKKAERMLKKSNCSIGEVSDAFGFSSAFHFSKVFKTYFGMSPSSYRKRRAL